MSSNFILVDVPPAGARPPTREDYFIKPAAIELHGRLGYTGQKPRLIGCEIFELSDTGAYVEPYAPLEGKPKIFTLEVNRQYYRARLVLTEGAKLRLEFLVEDLNYIDAG